MVVVALLFFKSNTTFKNPLTSEQQSGLSYSSETLENLVNKDTDGDGILDWEEGLWGTDPNKAETTPGVPDRVAIEKMKSEAGGGNLNLSIPDEENLTETDKFSRELFATIAALNQSGEMDAATIDALSASLAEKIGNPQNKKLFSLSDLNTTNNNNFQAFKTYSDALIDIQNIYTTSYTVLDVLEEFSVDENNVDPNVLLKLNPIIEQTHKIIDGMVAMSVPSSVASLHLSAVNSLERLVENLEDLKLYDTDAIVFFGAVSQYYPNTETLQRDLGNLHNAIQEKLNN